MGGHHEFSATGRGERTGTGRAIGNLMPLMPDSSVARFSAAICSWIPFDSAQPLGNISRLVAVDKMFFLPSFVVRESCNSLPLTSSTMAGQNSRLSAFLQNSSSSPRLNGAGGRVRARKRFRGAIFERGEQDIVCSDAFSKKWCSMAQEMGTMNSDSALHTTFVSGRSRRLITNVVTSISLSTMTTRNWSLDSGSITVSNILSWWRNVPECLLI